MKNHLTFHIHFQCKPKSVYKNKLYIIFCRTLSNTFFFFQFKLYNLNIRSNKWRSNFRNQNKQSPIYYQELFLNANIILAYDNIVFK